LSSVLENTDNPFFREVYCNSDHYLVVAKLKERLKVSKQTRQTFNIATCVGWYTPLIRWVLVQIMDLLALGYTLTLNYIQI
jgi:hypothetical protein